MTPHARRSAVAQLQERFAVSERRACQVLGVARSSVRYQPRPRLDQDLSQRLRILAAERPRFGYRRRHALLRREGLRVNHKRVYRLYRAADLSVRQRRRKRVSRSRIAPASSAARPNQRWSLDFMQDTLASGRRVRTLAVLDRAWRIDYNRVRPHSSLNYQTPEEVLQRYLRHVDGSTL